MAESHVVSDLIAKHADLSGLTRFHRAEIERIASDLKHLDATIKLFAPEMDLRHLGSKRRVNSSRTSGFRLFESRQSHIWVLDQLREAVEPLTTAMMAERVIVAKGLEESMELRAAIQRTLPGTLRSLEKRRLVEDAGRAENGLAVLWRIA